MTNLDRAINLYQEKEKNKKIPKLIDYVCEWCGVYSDKHARCNKCEEST